MVEFKATDEYSVWFKKQTLKARHQINARLVQIKFYGHFGNSKRLGDDLFELKWKNGRRIYFSMVIDEDGKVLVLLLGGNKNSQDKDIRSARRILGKFLKGNRDE